MRSGSGAITHGCWQDVPGLARTRIWPYLRKIDTVSSNSYIVQSGDLVVVIDPGGLPGQVEELRAAIGALPGGAQPVLVLLTHVHVDHCKAVVDNPFFNNPEHALLAVEENGALALASADARLTQAALLGQEIAPVRAGLRLFADLGSERCGDITVPCGTQGPAIRLSTAFEAGAGGTLRPRQTLRTGVSGKIVLYHTPGHSPDSICILIGPLLFIGDLMFAASPGVAGMSGWDREALVRSINEVLALLHGGGITYCCPGHGKILTCDEAVRVLTGVKKDAEGLYGIKELNLSRAKETAQYAEGLMDGLGEIFTIIAARLLFVSYVLDELEESEEASEVSGLIDAGRIDALLAEFQEFLAAYRAGNNRDIHLALKAGQVVQKLERVFAEERLELVLDPAYPRRAQRLLNDYTTVLKGYYPPRMLQPVAVAPLVSGLISQLNQSGPSDEDLISSADDLAVYTRALIQRIARVAIFDGITCPLQPGTECMTAEVDSAILCDVIRMILEEIAGSGSPRPAGSFPSSSNVPGRAGSPRSAACGGGSWQASAPAAAVPLSGSLMAVCNRSGSTCSSRDSGHGNAPALSHPGAGAFHCGSLPFFALILKRAPGLLPPSRADNDPG